jgi:hypothetical protein
MSAPPAGAGGPDAHREPPANTITNPATRPAKDTAPDAVDGNGTVVLAWGVAFAPAAGRDLWAYAVVCPGCGGVHLHRATAPCPEGHDRWAPCGERYCVLAQTVVGAVTV